MIRVFCVKCGCELKETGGIYFKAPDKYDRCEKKLLNWLYVAEM